MLNKFFGIGPEEDKAFQKFLDAQARPLQSWLPPLVDLQALRARLRPVFEADQEGES